MMLLLFNAFSYKLFMVVVNFLIAFYYKKKPTGLVYVVVALLLLHQKVSKADLHFILSISNL